MTRSWPRPSMAIPISAIARSTSATWCGCDDAAAVALAMRGIARHLGQRLLASLPALLGVVVLTFLLMRVLPGDPAVFFASGPNAGQEEIEALRREMGLDRPIPVQLVSYLGDIAQGNLGRSLTTGQPV